MHKLNDLYFSNSNTYKMPENVADKIVNGLLCINPNNTADIIAAAVSGNTFFILVYMRPLKHISSVRGAIITANKKLLILYSGDIVGKVLTSTVSCIAIAKNKLYIKV